MENAMSAAQARALLREAGMRRRAAAGFSPFVVGYAGMCGISALGSMAIRLAWQNPPAAAVTIAATLVFTLVTVFSPLFGGVPTYARGFSRRWGFLMGAWGVLWGITKLVPGYLISDVQVAFWAVAAIAVGFLVLLFVAVVGEGARVRRARVEGTGDDER